jgi:hypothetical protein
LDGVAARGLMSGRGPLRRSGRDEVGTSSDEAKPNSAYSPFEKSRVNGRALTVLPLVFNAEVLAVAVVKVSGLLVF